MAVPTLSQLEAIPTAAVGQFELTEKETRTLRSRLYSMNKVGWRKYRTMREGELVYVWRIY